MKTGLAVALALALAGLEMAGMAAEPAWADLLAAGDLRAWREPAGAWRAVGGASCHTQDTKKLTGHAGQGTILNGDAGRTSNLLSREEWGDVEAHVEFMVPEKSNSGVYFMARYEIQVFDSWGVAEPKYADCGGIYQRWADNQGFEGRAPRVNACRRPGEWQSYDVVFRAPRFDAAGNKTANAVFVKVAHNGVVIHENAEVTGPTRSSTYSDEKPAGPLMLQGDHGPVAYRNLRIRPLNQ